MGAIGRKHHPGNSVKSLSHRVPLPCRLFSFVLVSFLSLVVCSMPGLAADYYVALDGSDDTGVGSLSSPWGSINYAVNSVGPGDTVNVQGEVYHISSSITFEVSGLPGSPITLRSYDGRAVIRAEYNINMLRLYHNYLVIENITLEHGHNLLEFGDDVHNIVVRDVEAHDAQGSSVFFSHGAHDIELDGCDFHSIHATTHGCGNLIEIRGKEDALVSRITVRNSAIHGTGHNGFNFFASCSEGIVGVEMQRIDNFLIENCDIYDIVQIPIGTNCARVDNLIVRNCEISDSGRGIYITANNSVFEGNTFSNIVDPGIHIQATEAGNHNLIIRNNHIESYPGQYGVVVRSCYGAVVSNTTMSGGSGHVRFYGKGPSYNVVQDHEDGAVILVYYENDGNGVTVSYTDGRDFDVEVISGSAVVGALSSSGGVSERVITVTSNVTFEIQHDGSILPCTGECCSADETCGGGGRFVDSSDCGMLCCIGVCDGVDVSPPTIESVTARGDPNIVVVVFSEALDEASATNASNYAIDNGVSVSSGSMVTDGRSVILATSILSEGVTYTLTVNDVEDLAQNIIEPNSQTTFIYTAEQSGLVGHWKLDEENGTVAADSSGNGNDGTVQGGTSWTGGRLDGGLELDGVDGYVEIPTSDSLDSLGSEITLAAWVNTSVGVRQTIVERWLYDADEERRCFNLDVVENGGFRFALSSNGTIGGDAWLVSNGAISSDTWTHVVAVSDGHVMRIYIDGVEDTATITAPSTIFSSGGDVHIGRWWTEGEWVFPFSGIVDDVRIYDRALSAEEARDLAIGCAEGFRDCNGDPADGCEVDITSDVDNCGACGNQCGAEEVCINSQCQAECDPDLENCGGSCVDLKTNPAHCGSCYNACAPGVACVDGSCDDNPASAGGCGCQAGTGQEGLCGFLLMFVFLFLWGIGHAPKRKGL